MISGKTIPIWRAPKACPWCNKVFGPRKPNQIYCRESHRVMASNKRKADRGDVRVVKVCPFVIQTGPIEVCTYRCTLETGHPGPHLIQVPDADA